MSTPSNNMHDDDRKPAAKPSQSQPQFMSVKLQTERAVKPTSFAALQQKNTTFAADHEIDKSAYFRKPDTKETALPIIEGKSPWSPKQLRPVPAFYPLERSSRFVEKDLLSVVYCVSEANRLLSIHAVYCDTTATAILITSENVEMHLSLWKPAGNEDGVLVEIQRRKGDSMTFHRYSRCILDAAAGEIDLQYHVGEHGDDIDGIYSRNLQRMLTMERPKDSGSEEENAIIAIEIAHGLVMKDRIDARQLGLESLCLLTDPKKTGLTTAIIASRVVLLGSTRDVDSKSSPEDALLCDETPFQEIRQALLSLIQFRRIGDGDDFGEKESSEESEHITVLHNLALAVLANALDVISNEELQSTFSPDPENVPAGRARLDTSESISEKFLEDSLECSENLEIMKTLISELGKANLKPHNACLSAKCIGSLCRASNKARKRAKELGAKNVVQTALEVGTRTHLKLERECNKIMTSLTNETSSNNDE